MRSIASRAASADSTQSAMTATTRSALPAASPSRESSPACASSARFCGVAIIAAAAVTPAICSRSRDRRMSVTESR